MNKVYALIVVIIVVAVVAAIFVLNSKPGLNIPKDAISVSEYKSNLALYKDKDIKVYGKVDSLTGSRLRCGSSCFVLNDLVIRDKENSYVNVHYNDDWGPTGLPDADVSGIKDGDVVVVSAKSYTDGLRITSIAKI